MLVEEHGDYVAVVDSHAADAAARDNASPKCLPACNAVGGHAKGCPKVPPVPDFWEHGSVGSMGADWVVCNTLADRCGEPSNLRNCRECDTQVWVPVAMTPLVDSGQLRPVCWP
ncbi:MAG: hypothetical protein WAK86_14945, partial [Pseudonocardiaceae bacterium]